MDSIWTDSPFITVDVGERRVFKSPFRAGMGEVASDPAGWFVAPREQSSVLAARSLLPLRLGWEPLPGPPAVGVGLVPTDADHRVQGHLFRKRILAPELGPIDSGGEHET